MENTPRFAVTYGRTDYFAEEGLQTIFVSSAEEVRALAKQFIHVIPDDLEDYLKDIKQWKPTQRLHITHQDDDTFLFQADPIKLNSAAANNAFDRFVSEFNHDSGDEDEDSTDD